MKRIRDLKRSAREALSGNFGTVIGATVAVGALSLVGGMAANRLFPGFGLMDVALAQIFATILMLVFSVFTAGLSYMYLNIARKKEYSFRDLIYFFGNHPDRVIIATLVLAVLDILASIPLNCYMFLVESGTTVEAQMEWLLNYSLLMLLTSIINIVLSVPFVLNYFLLADNPEMTGMEAVKESVRLMKSRIGKYLLLQISFIPLLFLSAFTMYIALLWVMPYIQMTNVMFYRDILGELDPVQQVETVPSYYQVVQQSSEITEDEDNSEA